MDLVYDSLDKNFAIAKLLVLEHISDLKNKNRRNVRFMTTMKAKFSHEPTELAVTLEYTGDKGTGYAILGKASPVIDDTLIQFLKSERYAYRMNNYLANAELMSQRLVRNLHKFTDAATVSEIRVALREAIINAIEHGNLNLTFDEKTNAQIRGTYFDLIGERQTDLNLTEKRVSVEYSLNHDRVAYKITDEGEGFDYTSFLQANAGDPEAVMLTHGRGLFIISCAFDTVTFNKKGNQILLVKYFTRLKSDYL